MQHQIEAYIREGRLAMARSLVSALPSETHPTWYAVIDIWRCSKEDPKGALDLNIEDHALSEAAVRKAFK